jgi:hypothetical protein
VEGQHANRPVLRRSLAQVDAEALREDAQAVQLCDGTAELRALAFTSMPTARLPRDQTKSTSVPEGVR